MTSRSTPPTAELDALRHRIADLERAEAERARVADALRESEERSRSLMANIPGAVYRSDAQAPWRDIFVSEHVFALCGYTAQELTRPDGNAFGDLVLPEDRSIIEESVSRAAGRGGTFEIRYRIRHADGSIRWMHDQGRVLSDADGAPRWLEGVVVDVTDRMGVEVAFQESEERFRTLVGNIPGAVYRSEIQPPYRDLFISEGIHAISGYHAREYIEPGGPICGELILPEDRERVEAIVNAAVAAQRPFQVRYRIRHRDGSLRWVSEQGRATYAPDGTPLYLEGVHIDVTAEMVAQQALREQEERLRTILENEPECVKLLDRDGNLLEMNPAGLAMIEAKDFGQVQGRSFSPMVAAEDEPRFREMLAAVFRGESRTATFDLVGLRGTRRTLETHSVPLWEDVARSRVRALLGVSRDITERQRTEAARQESEERFRTLVANIPGAVYRCEVHWPYRDIFLSQGVQAITGYTASEHLAVAELDFGSRVHPEDRGRIEATVASAIANRTAFALRYRIRHADGGVRWVQEQGRATYAPDGSPLFLDGVLVDVSAEMRAAELLREQEERLRTVVENEPECVKLLDRDGNLLEMNPAGLAMIEADDLEQVRGHAICPMIAAADEPRFREMLAGVFRGESRRLEFDIIGLKGAHRSLETHSVPLWDDKEHSRVRALLGVTRDVTERRRAEAARQASEERYRSLVASVPGAVYLCNVQPPWKSTFMSEGVRALTGYGPEAFLRPDGVSFQSLVLPEDMPPMGAPVAEAIRRREPFVIRYRIRDAEGKIRWMLEQGRAAYDASGEPMFLVGVITDITDRMRAEEEVRTSRARLVEAQRIAHIGSWELDLQSNTLLWSEEIYRIFELDPTRFGATYEAFLNAVHPDDRDGVNRAYTTSLQSHTPYDTVHRLRMADGRIKYVHERAETMYAADGTPLRSVGTVQDVTERREAEAAREALEGQLRQAQKMEAIGTLAGGIAHDFNNILAAIIGHAELLGQDLPSDPALHEEIAAILRASRRARDLVQQILTFSRRREREHRLIALQPVILEALKLLRATLPATIEIRSEVDTVGPIASADATEIHQVIVNLGTNAAHAMAERGGVLSIGYAGVDVDEAFAGAHPGMHAGRHARLTVSDTGQGMDEQTMNRVFEPFFTTKAPGEGTGLGLAVVHGIMQSHGGVVTVRSTLGQGTTFDLYFPAVSGHAAAEVAEDPRPLRGSSERVLVVDDEPAVVNIARRMLEQLGYRVTAHFGPLQALAAFEADPESFDLVLCDLTMPQMTGLDFAARIHELRPKLPIILTSGYSGALDTQSMRRLGIRELVEKPYVTRTIAEAVARHLPRP